MKPAKTNREIIAPENWSDLPMGDWLAMEIQHKLDEWCPFMFGYHFLKLGTLSSQLSCTASTIRHQCAIASQGASLGINADIAELPIRSGSIDACLLAHTLDFSKDPHQILREVERVLTPDGWIIISGFNPYSLVGLGRLLPHLRRRLPWSARMFSPERVLDWLHLLGFEVVHLDGFAYSAFSRRSRIHCLRENTARRCGHRFASTYILAARKRTIPLTRIQEAAWLRRPVMVGGMARLKNPTCTNHKESA
ncbi:class I SAM-dependent methyltransferase [Tolumonas lignilytica]|uniref:class I SAM-dependent methyltransferase n=1 Tax=Tolumonas lignilytica TaxID=1283284 RepID=UPI0004631356|nr:class I SAM-dependent methyltransferase [Tolumonas lignilytica]